MYCKTDMENEIDFLKRNHCGTLSTRASNGSDGDSVSPDLGSN